MQPFSHVNIVNILFKKVLFTLQPDLKYPKWFLKYSKFMKKETQENARDLSQKPLFGAFEPDQKQFPVCYFGKFAIFRELFGII